VVRVQDQDGQPITSGPGATATITLSLAGNAAGATLACADGLTIAAVAGVATFSGCTISAATTGVILEATASNLTAAATPPFDVLAPGSAPSPDLSVTAPVAAIVWGNGVVLTAQLAHVAGSPLAASLAGRTVEFQASPTGTTWNRIATGVTNTSGRATLTYRPVTNLFYRAVFAAAADLGAVTSPRTRITVRQLAILRPSADGATRTLTRNQTLTFATLVRPSRADVAAGPVVVEVYRRVAGALKPVVTQRVQPDAGGTASIAVTFSSAGTWLVRSMASPTARNANSLWTPWETFRVL
jgi:hypothetical protein